MALTYIYEGGYFVSGWFDGKTLPSWWDEDITSQNGAIIQLDFLYPIFVDDPDTVFGPIGPLKIEVFPGLFLDEDKFFTPMSVRALDTPDKSLKNEIIRVR